MLVLLAAVAFAATGRADDYPLDPRVDVIAYRFEMQLSDADDAVHGTAIIRLAVGPGLDTVTFDLIGGDGTGMVVDAVSVDGAAATYAHANDRLAITVPAKASAAELVIAVGYSGTPADGLIIGTTKYGRRAFFGDNYPDRARYWLPTIDHVADKALVEFVVTAPDHYQVIASGALREETDLPGGQRRTTWASAVPLATKVMVIGVAEFAVRRLDPVDGVRVESWVYADDREAGFHDFSLARPILQYFIDHVGPYAYAKLASVQSRTRYGGMENAGNIFYSENAVRGDRSNEGLQAHEIAHQWFGDAVSEADWHHAWLSEGFATYFSQLYVEHVHGRERLLEAMRGARERALRYHASGPGYAIVDERFGMDGLLSANSYQKGSWVLHMLRREIGDEAFWSGIRAYYARFLNGNATSEDFREAMQQAAGVDLGWFFEQWLYTPGQPRLAGTWSWSDGTLVLQLRQLQEPSFRIAVDVGLTDGNGDRTNAALRLDAAAGSFRIDAPREPVQVALDPDVWLLFEDAGLTRAR